MFFLIFAEKAFSLLISISFFKEWLFWEMKYETRFVVVL